MSDIETRECHECLEPRMVEENDEGQLVFKRHTLGFRQPLCPASGDPVLKEYEEDLLGVAGDHV